MFHSLKDLIPFVLVSCIIFICLFIQIDNLVSRRSQLTEQGAVGAAAGWGEQSEFGIPRARELKIIINKSEFN